MHIVLNVKYFSKNSLITNQSDNNHTFSFYGSCLCCTVSDDKIPRQNNENVCGNYFISLSLFSIGANCKIG